MKKKIERSDGLIELPIHLNEGCTSPYVKRSYSRKSVITNSLMIGYNYRCVYCGRVVKRAKGHLHADDNATGDHVYNKFDMRRALSKKLVLCCLKCNNDRNQRDLVEFYSGYRYRATTPITDLCYELGIFPKWSFRKRCWFFCWGLFTSFFNVFRFNKFPFFV
jgi:hypothetical protein